MEPIPNSDSYDKLVEDENTLENPRLTGLEEKNFNFKILQRDMFKYMIHKQNQAKFFLALNFAPKRVNSLFPGVFELVKIKSNDVDLIRIFIADEQVKIHFHPLFDSRNWSMIGTVETSIRLSSTGANTLVFHRNGLIDPKKSR